MIVIMCPDLLQSQHLPEETLGNQFLPEVFIQQQSRLMGLYGLGVMVLMEDLELIIPTTEVLQSRHLPEERIGNRFLVEIIIQQQSKLMGLYGLGVIMVRDNWEQILVM